MPAATSPDALTVFIGNLMFFGMIGIALWELAWFVVRRSPLKKLFLDDYNERKQDSGS